LPGIQAPKELVFERFKRLQYRTVRKTERDTIYPLQLI